MVYPVSKAEEIDYNVFEAENAQSLSYPIILPRRTTFFFIVGSMKSGTTWLMNTLDFHPDICCKGEMHSVEMLDLNVTLPTLESIARHSDSLKQWYCMPNNGWSRPFVEGKENPKIKEDIEKDLIRFFFEWTIQKYLKLQNKGIPSIIGDKSPSHTRFIVRKLQMYFGVYQPYILHIVRDPRDVAVSRWFHIRRLQRQENWQFVPHFRSDSDKQACEDLLNDPESYVECNPFFLYPEFLLEVFSEWIDVNGALLREGRLAFGDRYHIVRYEDMKESMNQTLTGVLRWLGLEDSNDQLSSIVKSSDIMNMSVKPDVFRKGIIGEWKKYFNFSEIKLFNEYVLPLSEQFGYR